MKDKIVACFYGFAIGDALGVPVEFKSRDYLKEKPIRAMTEFGTYNQPSGTWSDDSSMAFCLAESLCNGYNIKDVADKFKLWAYDDYWTPHGDVFDIGMTTKKAIEKLRMGVSPYDSGGKSKYDNGNGSLMRIAPLIFYLINEDTETQFRIIHEVSGITHRHPISLIACSFYVQMGIAILNGKTLEQAYEYTINIIMNYYKDKNDFKYVLSEFSRILKKEIITVLEENISSDGYVLHTLEASLWCLFNNSSYVDSVLAAVNLGEDTDTTATVTGGLAGLYYGLESFPQKWINQLARKDDILDLCERFYNSVVDRS